MNAFHKVMQNCWDYRINLTTLKSQPGNFFKG